MRSHILAVAVVAGLGLASSPYAHAQSSKKAKPVAATSSTATEIEALKAQLAAMQSQIQQLQTQVAQQEAQSDAQSEVNVVQAQAIEASAATTTKVDGLSKLVNDNKIGGRIFFDLTSVDQKNNGVKTNSTGTGFDVKRFYLTFDHKFNDIWSANITTDAQYFSVTPGPGSANGDGKRADSVEVFIKKAYVQGKFDDAFTVRVGAADMPWVPFVEKYYGYRYVENTLIDRLSYGTSADWGVHAFGDLGAGFNYATSVVSGGGYRNPGRSKGMDWEGRLGFAPTPETIIAIGGYTGERAKETQNFDPPQTAKRFDAMAAYAGSKFRAGVEYFQAKNWAVTNTVEDKVDGYSGWANVALTDGGINLFARYDKAKLSKDVDPNLEETYYNLGVEFPVTKGFKLATVYKNTHRDNDRNIDTKTSEFGVWGDVSF